MNFIPKNIKLLLIKIAKKHLKMMNEGTGGY